MCSYQTSQAACNYLTSDCLSSIHSPLLSSSESTCLEFGYKEKLYRCNLTFLIFLSHPFQYWWDVLLKAAQFTGWIFLSACEEPFIEIVLHSWSSGFSTASSLEVGQHHIQLFSWITWDILRWSVIPESQYKRVAEPSGSFQTPSCIVYYCDTEWATSWSESYRIDLQERPTAKTAT